jgi:hypothetical protein
MVAEREKRQLHPSPPAIAHMSVAINHHVIIDPKGAQGRSASRMVHEGGYYLQRSHIYFYRQFCILILK